MTSRFHHLLVAAGLGAAIATAILVIETPPAAPQQPACLAVATGVCFSGTTAWVASAAATLQRESEVKLAMSGDAE
jgi:hypothetical protein